MLMRRVSAPFDSSGGVTITIDGLLALTGYTLEVAAQTSAGTGVYSDPLTFTTPDCESFRIILMIMLLLLYLHQMSL